jgi:exodeoxyribonuclease VII small subunit
MAGMTPKRNLTPPKSFEEGLGELEKILADIEGGQLTLEDSLVKYDRGSFLIQYCRTVLESAEKQIELLSKAPDGGMKSEPLATRSDKSDRSATSEVPPADSED